MPQLLKQSYLSIRSRDSLTRAQCIRCEGLIARTHSQFQVPNGVIWQTLVVLSLIKLCSNDKRGKGARKCSDILYGGYPKGQRRCQYRESCLSHGTIDSSILGSLIRLGRCEYRDYCQLRTIRSSHLAPLVRPTFFLSGGICSASAHQFSACHEIVVSIISSMMNPANCVSYLLFTCSKCLRVRQRWVPSGGWSKRVQLWLKVERSQNLLTVRSRGVS